jgi:hypothetical protein
MENNTESLNNKHEHSQDSNKCRKKNKKIKQSEKSIEQPDVVDTNTAELSAPNSQRSSEDPKDERKPNDSPSNSSVDGSTRRFFLESLKENAKVLQSQIGELQNDASDYMDKWIMMMKKFENMKAGIDSRLNNFFRGVFGLLGYNYHIDVEKINFFIFATQSWLMEVTKIAEKKMQDYISRDKKFTYKNLLTIMKESEITDDNFLSNLGILTSSTFSEINFSSTVIENNVGKLFLNNLSLQLQGLDITEDIDGKRFEQILTDVLRKAVENALNTMENQFNTDGVRNIPYSELYDDRLSYEEFFERVKEGQTNLNQMGLYSLKICTESFYYFAKCRLEEMIRDVNFFTKNYSSLLFKSRMFLGQNVLNTEKVCIFLSRVFNYVDNASHSLNNLRKEKLNEFYSLAHKLKNELVNEDHLKALVRVKQQVQDAVVVRSQEIYNKVLSPYVYPLKTYTVNFATNVSGAVLQLRPMTVIFDIRDFILNQWNLSKEDYHRLKTKLTDYINSKYNEIFVHIKPILYIEKDGETYFRFTLNRTFTFIDPMIILDIYHYINNFVKAIKEKLVEKVDQVKQLGCEKFQETKEFCIFRYKKFLGLCDEKKDL